MNHHLSLLIKNAFSTAVGDKDELKSNTLRSAKFIECVAKNIFEHLLVSEQNNNSNLYVQKVKADGSGKLSGEWLLDAVIREDIIITDRAIKNSQTRFVSKILWAIESESHTSLNSMAEDFGKLAVVRSANYLYLNGLNQTHQKALNYIKRRLSTIESLIDRLPTIFQDGNLYYGFWPTPGKAQGYASYWDADYKMLLKMVKLYFYDNGSFHEVEDL
jgi:hypothetical protein